MVEGPWPNTTQEACMSFNVHNDCRSLLKTPGVWGCCKPPSGSRAEPWWGCRGAKSPEALRILHFTVPERMLKTGLKTLSYYDAFLPVL